MERASAGKAAFRLCDGSTGKDDMNDLKARRQSQSLLDVFVYRLKEALQTLSRSNKESPKTRVIGTGQFCSGIEDLGSNKDPSYRAYSRIFSATPGYCSANCTRSPVS